VVSAGQVNRRVRGSAVMAGLLLVGFGFGWVWLHWLCRFAKVSEKVDAFYPTEV
jgi:hypothetical protein